MATKEIVLFGAGKLFENYMMCYGTDERMRPCFVVDNNRELVGRVCFGVAVRAPEVLRNKEKDSFYVVICCARYKEIAAQLEEMGIYDYQYYRPVPMEQAVPKVLSEDGRMLVPANGVCSDRPENAEMGDAWGVNGLQENEVAVTMQAYAKPYKIGYVPGVFDLFHVGHLNLLRNAKNRCEYLIAGVLTDELVEHFKNRRPIIPYEQRAAIVAAISYVDRVVPVDFENTRKIDAWKKYRFDCHFSGNDHGSDWAEDVKQLREVGAEMEFFEYTKATSSTAIRKKLQ